MAKKNQPAVCRVHERYRQTDDRRICDNKYPNVTKNIYFIAVFIFMQQLFYFIAHETTPLISACTVAITRLVNGSIRFVCINVYTLNLLQIDQLYQ